MARCTTIEDVAATRGLSREAWVYLDARGHHLRWLGHRHTLRAQRYVEARRSGKGDSEARRMAQKGGESHA